jgi:gas vesicle protein
MGKGATVMSEYERQNRGLPYEPSAQEAGSEVGARSDKSPEEIEREIEQTRTRLSRDIDELGNRLSPQNLKEEAKTAIKDAAHGAVSNVGEQARRTGSRLVEVIRENPLPVIAVGAGVTWLLTQRSRSDFSGDRMARYAYTGAERRQGEGWQSGTGIKGRVGSAVSEAKDSVSEAASGVADRASELKDRAGEKIGKFGGQARRQTQRIKTNLEHQAESNPLAVAIGAAVVGLALGLLLPGTQREDDLMGPARDKLVDRAEQTAERVKDAAVEAGREVKETVKAEIEQHKPEVKEVVQQAGQTVKEQVKESARRVKNEAKDAAKKSGNNPRSTT